MKKLLTTLALLVGLVALAGPAMAGSTVINVTKTADTNDGTCDQDCSLREAIVRANTSGADEIAVPAGTYKLTIAGSDEDLAATGDLDIRTSVIIRGAGARETIVDGGGIDRVFHTPSQFTSTPYSVGISGVTITGGSVRDTIGGGILHEADTATLNLFDSTVRGNRAHQGGGITNRGVDSTVTISRGTISGNKAEIGGGIQNERESLTLTNSTVSGNSSERYGGGIENFDGTATITNSTIAFNKAKEQGGGINVNSSTTFENTIVANNKSKAGFDANCNDSSDNGTSSGNNLENGTSCGFDQSNDINAKKPKLGKKLKNNGGPTNTHALKTDSPAIDAGDNAACASPPVSGVDQRNEPRPDDGNEDGVAICDIGAFEKD